MSQDALLPSRLLPRLGGRPTGGGTPARVETVLVLFLEPHRTDRFRHALENAYWAPSIVLCICGKRVVEKASSQTLLNGQTPRLTGWAGGEFPGSGRTLPSCHRRSLVLTVITTPRVGLRSLALPATPSDPSSDRSSGSTRCAGPACAVRWSALAWEASPWVSARISPP